MMQSKAVYIIIIYIVLFLHTQKWLLSCGVVSQHCCALVTPETTVKCSANTDTAHRFTEDNTVTQRLGTRIRTVALKDLSKMVVPSAAGERMASSKSRNGVWVHRTQFGPFCRHNWNNSVPKGRSKGSKQQRNAQQYKFIDANRWFLEHGRSRVPVRQRGEQLTN